MSIRINRVLSEQLRLLLLLSIIPSGVFGSNIDAGFSIDVVHDRIGKTIRVAVTNYSKKQIFCSKLILKSVFLDSKVMLDERTVYTAIADFSVRPDETLSGDISYTNAGVLQFTDLVNPENCR